MPDTERLEELRRKLKARKGKPGYEEAAKDIEAEIKRLEGNA